MNMNETIFIRKEQEGDNTEINALYANSFGPGRYVKSTFRYREKYDHLMDISQVIICQSKIIGSVRFWNILVNNENSLLLGPIVMHRDYRGQGFGKRLLKDSILNCKNLGHNLIILVGDLSYYSKVGFKRIGLKKILFEGPVNYERVLYIEFNKSIIEHSADIKINKFID